MCCHVFVLLCVSNMVVIGDGNVFHLCMFYLYMSLVVMHRGILVCRNVCVIVMLCRVCCVLFLNMLYVYVFCRLICIVVVAI